MAGWMGLTGIKVERRDEIGNDKEVVEVKYNIQH